MRKNNSHVHVMHTSAKVIEDENKRDEYPQDGVKCPSRFSLPLLL